jgi:Amt family ammonium transporter
VNTSLAACAGAIGAMIMAWIRFGKPDTSMTLNGVLAGLVGITAGCYEVSPAGSILIGLIAGFLVVLSVEFIDKVLHIDDPVGAVSVHGVCGAFGTLAVGLFAAPGYGDQIGLFYGGGISLLLVQLVGIAVVFAWAFGTGLVLFKVIKAVVGIRVSETEELKGLDITEHGMESYNGFQIFTTE